METSTLTFWLIVQTSGTLLAGNNLPIVESIEPTRKTSSTKSTLGKIFSNTLSSVHTNDSGISDHLTVTLIFEQSRENSPNRHEKFARKWVKLENRKFVGDFNNILIEKLKIIIVMVVNGPP